MTYIAKEFTMKIPLVISILALSNAPSTSMINSRPRIGQSKNYKITDFTGIHYKDDDILFKSIAPYMEDGYLELVEGDGYHWKWVFKNGRVTETKAIGPIPKHILQKIQECKNHPTSRHTRVLKEWRIGPA